MEQDKKDALQASLHYLCENMQDLSKMLLYLLDNKVITKENEDEIRAGKDDYDRSKALLDCLMTKKGGFGHLLMAFEETQQAYLVEHIEKNKANKRNEEAPPHMLE